VTIALVVKVNDGYVLASDSATTVGAWTPNGEVLPPATPTADDVHSRSSPARTRAKRLALRSLGELRTTAITFSDARIAASRGYENGDWRPHSR
jgi:hypothetical protein